MSFPSILVDIDDIKRMKDMAPHATVIAAHLGANGQPERAREYVGTSGILLDLSWVMEMCHFLHVATPAEIAGIIREVGVDRIVYGSDYPWADPGKQLEFWEGLLPDDDWKKIAHQNAERELGL